MNNEKHIMYIFLWINFVFWGYSFIAQTDKYFIAFKNKNNNGYSVSNPSAFLSAKAIQRRVNQGIPIDYTDLPVTPSYVNQIESLSGVTVLHRLKWLNGVIIQTTNTVALSAIQSYTYVQSTQPLNRTVRKISVDSVKYLNLLTDKTYSYNYGSMYNQIHQLNLECLHNAGYRGEGMIIAVIDDGFYNAHNNPVFDSLIQQGRLLGTRDFVNRDTMVFEDDFHGMYVLSTMAALKYGNMIGTAPKASYWLLRSEDISSEYPIEEYYWIRAAEFADSAGADIITVSLGYTTFDNSSYNHTYSMLNGKTIAMSKCATMAARKGIFVCVAAGNEGNSSWYYISVPADADSVCTVGGVDIAGNVASFSSKGPTADGRIKPDVCAMGVNTTVSDPNGIAFTGNGTSFATPLIAGAAACLWQAKPSLTNMQLLNLIKQYSSNASSPNNSIGWGIPDFCAAYTSIEFLDEIEKVKVYPNPVNADLNITSHFIIDKIKITDLLGHVVMEKDIHDFSGRIDLSQLMSGVYFASIVYDKENVVNKKIIKQ
ncbi:MAG: peptidase S8 [Bacteroidia bacterium]|nr:MAG: peptidase S8 [Bacteroidia bacterium]